MLGCRSGWRPLLKNARAERGGAKVWRLGRRRVDEHSIKSGDASQQFFAEISYVRRDQDE